MRKRIVCITRKDRAEDPHRHISHVGIGDDDGWKQMLMVDYGGRNARLRAGTGQERSQEK